MLLLILLLFELLALPLATDPPLVVVLELALPLDELCDVELLKVTLLLLVDVVEVVLTIDTVLMLP